MKKPFLTLALMMKKNIPNLFTLGNLFCGCIAIVFASQGQSHGSFEFVFILISLAVIMDFFDGFFARILKVKSELGKQLDSLGDMVSFGVVPGVMMFMHLEAVCHNDSIALIAFLITIFSAIRLAKFNLDERQTDSFIGLPTPANAILISSLFLVDVQYAFHYLIDNPYFIISICFISSFLLVAPLHLFGLKFKNFSWADNRIRYVFLVIALVFLILFQFVGIPLIIILYIVLSVINNILTRSKT